METLESRKRPEQVESPERAQLRELEMTGLYVFHGTAANVDELEPRQAVDATMGPDDEPGVHASQFADYGVFMAVAAPLGHTSAGTVSTDGSFTLNFAMSRDVADQLTDGTEVF
jgi:hypothetical protein